MSSKDKIDQAASKSGRSGTLALLGMAGNGLLATHERTVKKCPVEIMPIFIVFFTYLGFVAFDSIFDFEFAVAWGQLMLPVSLISFGLCLTVRFGIAVRQRIEYGIALGSIAAPSMALLANLCTRTLDPAGALGAFSILLFPLNIALFKAYQIIVVRPRARKITIIILGFAASGVSMGAFYDCVVCNMRDISNSAFLGSVSLFGGLCGYLASSACYSRIDTN